MNEEVMRIEDVLHLTNADMQQVNQHLTSQLNSQVVLINQIAHYIINNGGKRLRPVIMMLLAKALDYKGKQHINLAAVVEMIHTATLLHDDVVDESDMRRGEKTSHEIWGNAASVLVGDFLYSKSFRMMVTADSMEVMAVMSKATNTISEGEVQQLLNIGNQSLTEKDYYQIIANKTAKLFEAACELVAIISEVNSNHRQKLAQYGLLLGTAFQIADDVLDYTADDDALGKNIGDDFNEGKLTLPLIYILNKGPEQHKQSVSDALNNPSETDFMSLRQLVNNSGAIEYTLQQAKLKAEQAKTCLSALPDSKAKQALQFLCDYTWQRNI
ncbi:polyprenyl synthetase family protein [Marinicella gelatinilytica]|uniref:polyprenyl synthetase family protein n=1 Tax=Marinicella gelatinilytica TaxID=2996017 RepID=UPI0022609388|nr:polyprenyl synthetase family protein [Marinicella gelatinilytica]MCX7544573.1 polyprenyl synthetase family protein [Marinicella gelatinilytica]